MKKRQKMCKIYRVIAGFGINFEEFWDLFREACRRVGYCYLLFDRSENKKTVISLVATRTDQAGTLTVYQKQIHCSKIIMFLYLVKGFLYFFLQIQTKK